MNTLKVINTRNFLMTLMILAGMSACHKEEVKPEENDKVPVAILNQTKEGDDDEEVILQGGISYSNNNPVVNASVYLYIVNTTTPIDSTISDTNGEFEMEVENGDYFIEIIETNSNSIKTNDFTVDGSTSISIVI